MSIAFEMSDTEEAKAKAWEATQLEKNNCMPTLGERFSYTFTPTSIGVAVSVTDNMLNEKLDVTDYDLW